MQKPILLLDDEAPSLDSVGQALQVRGYGAIHRIAISSDEARTEFEASRPELVFINLGSQEPLASCDAIRDTPDGAIVPIIFVGPSDNEHGITSPSDALSRGGDYFFSTPLDVNRVLSKVKTYVGPGSPATMTDSEVTSTDAAGPEFGASGGIDITALGSPELDGGTFDEEVFSEAKPKSLNLKESVASLPEHATDVEPSSMRRDTVADASDALLERIEQQERELGEKLAAEAKREQEETEEQARAQAAREREEHEEHERKAREEAEAQAARKREEQERKAREEAEAQAARKREEQERKAREEAEAARKREEHERKAREEAEAEAARKREEHERKAREEAEAEAARKREEQERKAREEAEAEAARKREEQERKAREEAEAEAARKREEQERKAREEAEAEAAREREEQERERSAREEAEKRAQAEAAELHLREELAARKLTEAKEEDRSARDELLRKANAEAEAEAAMHRIQSDMAPSATSWADPTEITAPYSKSEEASGLNGIFDDDEHPSAEEGTAPVELVEAERLALEEEEILARETRERRDAEDKRREAARQQSIDDERLALEERERLRREEQERRTAQAERMASNRRAEIEEKNALATREFAELADQQDDSATLAEFIEDEASPDPVREIAPGVLALVPAEGSFDSAFDIASLFHKVFKHRVTGRIEFLSHHHQKSLSFDRGCPVDAYSSQVFDRMEEFLYRDGKITKTQYQEVRVKGLRGPRKIASYLVTEGYIKAEELFEVVRRHLESILFSIFEFQEGEYRYIQDRVEDDDRVMLDLDPRALIVEGIRRKYALPRLMERVGAPSSLLGPTGDSIADTEALGFTPDERKVVRLIDGTRNIEDIVFSTGLGAHRVYQVLASLLITGQIKVMVRGIEGVNPDGTSATDEIDRNRITEKHEHVKNADYFQILGVSRHSTPYEVGKAYERNTRDFAKNRFSETLRVELEDQIDEIEQVLIDARDVLCDEVLRESYARHLP